MSLLLICNFLKSPCQVALCRLLELLCDTLQLPAPSSAVSAKRLKSGDRLFAQFLPPWTNPARGLQGTFHGLRISKKTFASPEHLHVPSLNVGIFQMSHMDRFSCAPACTWVEVFLLLWPLASLPCAAGRNPCASFHFS